jgi:hypothetical protein
MRRPLLAVALAASLALSGCAGTTSYPASVKEQLRTTILDVTTAASQNDFQGALNHLNDLQNELQDARDRGDISEARFNTVTAAIAQVVGKITAKMIAGGVTPTPQPTRPPSSGSTGTKRTQAPTDGTKAPAQPQPGSSQAPSSSQAPPPAPVEPPVEEPPAPETTETPTPTPSVTPSEAVTPSPSATTTSQGGAQQNAQTTASVTESGQ